MWTVRDTLIPMALLAMVLVLAGFAIQVWPEQWGGASSDETTSDFELYDCIPLSDLGSPASVTGAGSIVEIGGAEYVRMDSVGELVAHSSSGRTTTYTVGPAELDLVLLTGQSNSVYYTSPQYYEGDSPVAPGKAFYLGTEEGSGTLAGLATASNVWSSGIVDMVASDGGVRVAQMYPALCSGYVSETGHRVLVVNTGIGGKAISAWDDNGECDNWMTTVLQRVAELASDGSVVLTPTVALWSQGESDADETEDYYEGKLLALLEKLWEGHYSGYSFEHVLSVLPRHPNYESPIAPASAQMAVASEHTGFTIASSLPLRFSADQTRDGIHYTQEAYGWLGEAFARSAALALGRTAENQTIVLPEDVGTVAELPAEATAYGTSGQAFVLPVAWTETATAGEYSGAFSGNPLGTRILPGMAASATLESETTEQESE